MKRRKILCLQETRNKNMDATLANTLAESEAEYHKPRNQPEPLHVVDSSLDVRRSGSLVPVLLFEADFTTGGERLHERMQEVHANGDRPRDFPSADTSVVNGSHLSHARRSATSGAEEFQSLEPGNVTREAPSAIPSQLTRGHSFVSRFSVSSQSEDSASESEASVVRRGRPKVRTTRAARLRSESARRKRVQLEEEEARRKEKQADSQGFVLEKGFPLTPRDRGISSDRLRPVDFPASPRIASGGPATPGRKLRLSEDELRQSGERQYLVARQYEQRRALLRQQEASQYKFSPSITRRAQSAGVRGRARFEQLYASADVTRMRRLTAEHDPELTFRPAITGRARRLRRRPSETFSQLYNRAQVSAERRAAEQMAVTASMTFQPRLHHSRRRRRSSTSSAATASGRISNSTSRGVSLYERGRQSQQRKELLRKQQEELEASQCSFRPQINPQPQPSRQGRERSAPPASTPSRSPKRSQSVDATVDRLLKYGKVAESRRAMLQKAKEAQEQQAVTGRPSIPARSRELADRRRAEKSQGKAMSVAERLHAEYKERLLQLAEKRRALQAERKAPFQPRVNRRSLALAKQRSRAQSRSRASFCCCFVGPCLSLPLQFPLGSTGAWHAQDRRLRGSPRRQEATHSAPKNKRVMPQKLMLRRKLYSIGA